MKLQFIPSYATSNASSVHDLSHTTKCSSNDENTDFSNMLYQFSLLRSGDPQISKFCLTDRSRLDFNAETIFSCRNNEKDSLINVKILELTTALSTGNDPQLDRIVSEMKALDSSLRQIIAAKLKYMIPESVPSSLKQFINGNDLGDQKHALTPLIQELQSENVRFSNSVDHFLTSLKLWVNHDCLTLGDMYKWQSMIKHHNNADQAEVSKICAYHFIPTSKYHLLSTIFNKHISYSDKIKTTLSVLNCSKIEDLFEKECIDVMSFLILEALLDRHNCAEDLLMLATSLKTSIKTLFVSCSPQLFYLLLVEGGKAVRCNLQEDTNAYFKLFPENSFQLFSKGFVYELASLFSEVKSRLDHILNSAFSLVFFAKFSSLPTFIWLLNALSSLFSEFIFHHGRIAQEEINRLLGLLLQEATNSDSNHHIAAIAKLAFDLDIKDCVQNNMTVKAIFSTLGNILLFDFLFPSSSSSAPVPNSLLKCCSEILRDPKHPFKLLALCGLKSLYSAAKRNSESEFIQRLENTVASFELVSFYPFCLELQDVLFGTGSKYEDFKVISFFSGSFIKLHNSGNLADLLLVFVSWLRYKNGNDSKSSSVKAYELCAEKLLLVAKEKASQIVGTYAEYWIDSDFNPTDWSTLLSALEAIQVPNSFSEWLFTVYTKALDYCKPFEKECFQSLLPAALADPLSIIPIMPSLLVASSISQNINFLKAVFKSEVVDMFNRFYFDMNSVEIVLKVLQNVFTIFTSISNDILDFPTWRSLFTIDELCILYTKTLKLNMTEMSTFFMQLIWSLDNTRIGSNELYEMFVLAKDYKSALGVFSSTSCFTTERAVYTFMSDRCNNYAEIGLKMLMNQGESKLDAVFLQNHAHRADPLTFDMHLNHLSRNNPEKMELYDRVLLERGRFLPEATMNLIPIKTVLYESERATSNLSYPESNDSTFLQSNRRDNASLLLEAKSLRRMKDFENAFHVLSNVDLSQDSFWTLKYYLELGNWFYASGKFNTAVQIFKSLSKEQKSSKLLSKIFRKLAVSMNASKHYSDHEIMDAFERSVASDKSSAKAYFEMALYQDTRPNKSSDDVSAVIKNFARTLLNSRKFDHLAYPRLITIWLNNTSNEKKTFELMKTFITSAPTSQAVNHLSQLISRIGHPNQSSHLLISALLEKIFYDYPDATLWKIGSVVHSANELRKSRAMSLLNKVISRDKACDIDVFLQICQLFLDICDMNVPNDVAKVSLSKELRRFKRLLSSGSLIAAPNSTLVYRPELKEEYDYILNFDDQCVTLPSLQRPKKLRISFNNAKFMNVLLKPKDDLRRDSRFMELCYFLNRNFAKKRLKYEVKTFAVTPLNDECGIIEWVENTAGLRNVLIKTYKKLNISIQRRDMKDIIEMKIDEYEKFTKFLLPRFPPVLMRWFFEKFPSLDRWSIAIKDYSHSMAAMSMIGYIMGLGDRHGENILFDEKSGSCVHVDFNCLFDKGKTFQFPEKVPFRLTQNLVHAFGAGGVEAKFKPASIAVMNCLWESKRSILTNLEAFLHDPLVEWARPKNPSKAGAPIYDITNEMATQTLKIVDRKLTGYIENENYSCEGQVEKLIQHATDKKNLSQMYFGWAAFL